MRKILLFIATFFLLQTVSAQENKVRFGLKSGFNISIFNASINSESDFKTGFHIGAYLRSSIGKNTHFRPELYFSSQGQKDNFVSSNGQSTGKTTTKVNYLNLPLLFEIGKRVNFQCGPQIGMLLSASEEGRIDNKPVNDDLKEIMKAVEIAFVLGVSYNVGDNFNFGTRFNIGMTPIFVKPEGAPIDFPSVKNRVFHFFVGCTF